MYFFLGGLASLGDQGAAHARPANRVDFDIARQPLGSAIEQFALQSGRQIFFTPSAETRRPSPALRGRMGVEEALRRLLGPVGLRFRKNRFGIFLVEAAPNRPALSAGTSQVQAGNADLVVVANALPDPIAFASDVRSQPRTLSIGDILQTTLGMAVQPSSSGQQSILTRGMGVAGEPTTVVYFSDVPIIGPAGTMNSSGRSTSDLALVDIMKVETSRSPQGTEHGIGALSGEVKIFPPKPKFDEWSGFGTVGVGAMTNGGPSYQMSGAINIPVAAETAVRISAYARHSGGYIDNVRTGGGNVNAEDVAGVRMAVRHAPAPDVDLSGLMIWQHRRIADPGVWTQALGPFRTDRYFSAPTTHEFLLGQFKVAAKLGGINLTSISSYYRWQLDRSFDRTITTLQQATDPAGCQRYLSLRDRACDAIQMADFASYVAQFAPTLLHVPITVDRLMQEMRLDGGSGDFQWLLGAFVEHRREHFRVELSALPTLSDPDPPFFGKREVRSSRAQQALFGTLSYDDASNLFVSLGLRLDRHRMTASNVALVPNMISGSTMSWLQTRESANGVHGKLHLDIPLNKTITLHAQVARSFRPGGINSVSLLPEGQLVYKGDRLWGYELGAKLAIGSAADLRAVAYVNSWQDMQYRAFTENRTHAYIVNIGDANVQGLEVEFAARPTKGLSLRIEGSMIDTRLRGSATARALTGNAQRNDPIPFVPRHRLQAIVNYARRLDSTRNIGIDWEWQFQSGFWSTFNQDDPDFVASPGYHVVGVGASIEAPGSTLSLSVRNLLNSRAIMSMSTNGYGVGQSFSYGPRSIELSWTRKW